jgi:hypothetical protein
LKHFVVHSNINIFGEQLSGFSSIQKIWIRSKHFGAKLFQK